MKKNTLILLSSAIWGMLSLASCDLSESPYGFYSENNFYKTEADAEAAVNYIYDAITYIEFSRAIVFLGDMPTDVLDPKTSTTENDNQQLDEWKLESFKSNSSLGNFYKYCYITINRANAVIKNVALMNIDEKIKQRYVGEAYFMRAYAYFSLTRNFGLVPLHLEPVETLEQSTVGAAKSLDELWGVIISDLELAINNLPFFEKAEPGRADKTAAYSLLAKTYLYLASAKEHNTPKYVDMSLNVDDYYIKAAEYAAKVVDNPEQTVFGFESNLLDIYDVEKPDGKEHIFIMSMDRTGIDEGQYSKLSKMYLPYVSGGTIYMKQGNTDKMIASHDGWSEYVTNARFYNSFEIGDLRHDWLIVDKVYNAAGEVIASVADKKLSYPFCRKFIDPNFIGDKTSTRPYLIRYSDIALTYAEAVGPTAKAYDLVNYVRNRAGLSNLEPNLSLEAFREAVLLERKYELAFEGNWCYDLRRWNRLHTDIEAAREQGLSADMMVFYPIPSMETDLNPNL